MSLSDETIWLVIAVLGIGTYLMRFSFLGLLGGRSYPDWALRILRYAPHAVLPGMIVPMLIPQDGGSVEPFRLVAAGLALLAGLVTRSTIAGLGTGALVWFGAKAVGLA